MLTCSIIVISLCSSVEKQFIPANKHTAARWHRAAIESSSKLLHIAPPTEEAIVVVVDDVERKPDRHDQRYWRVYRYGD